MAPKQQSLLSYSGFTKAGKQSPEPLHADTNQPPDIQLPPAPATGTVPAATTLPKRRVERAGRCNVAGHDRATAETDSKHRKVPRRDPDDSALHLRRRVTTNDLLRGLPDRLARQSPALQSIELQVWDQAPPTLEETKRVVKELACLPSLTGLEIFWPRVTNKQAQVLAGLAHLQSLKLRSRVGDSDGYMYSGCHWGEDSDDGPSVRGRGNRLTDRGLKALGEGLLNLTELHIDSELIDFSRGCPSNYWPRRFVTLQIHGHLHCDPHKSNEFEYWRRAVSNLPNLKDLQIGVCFCRSPGDENAYQIRQDPEPDLTFLSHLTGLKKLALGVTDEEDGWFVRDSQCLHVLSRLTALSDLHLQCEGRTFMQQAPLLSALPSLRALAIDFADGDDIFSVHSEQEQAIASLTNLTRLALYEADMDYESFATAIQPLSRLKELRLPPSGPIGKALANLPRGLTALQMSVCKGEGDDMRQCMQGLPPGLMKLWLRREDGQTVLPYLGSMLSGAPNLVVLVLEDFPAVDAGDLLAAIEPLTRLERIYTCECTIYGEYDDEVLPLEFARRWMRQRRHPGGHVIPFEHGEGLQFRQLQEDFWEVV